MPTSVARKRNFAFSRQAGRCFYCRLPMWLSDAASFAAAYGMSDSQALAFQCTAEHLQARKDGGGNSQSNIVAACRRCNARRHARKKPLTVSAYIQFVHRRMQARRWVDIRQVELVQRIAKCVAASEDSPGSSASLS